MVKPETVSFVGFAGPAAARIARHVKQFIELPPRSKGWVCEEDVTAGSMWLPQLKEALRHKHLRLGIMVITKEGLPSWWLKTETAVLAGRLRFRNVFPLLIDVDAAELPEPISWFQAIRPTREQMFRLLRKVNDLSAKLRYRRLKDLFDREFPKWSEELWKLMPTRASGEASANAGPVAVKPDLVVSDPVRPDKVALITRYLSEPRNDPRAVRHTPQGSSTALDLHRMMKNRRRR